MRSHRVKVTISKNRELHVKLPSDFPPGEAEVIVLELRSGTERMPSRKLTVDELLARKLSRPAGVGPVTLADMERAISERAAERSSV